MKKWRMLTDDTAPSANAVFTVVNALADDLNTAGAISVLHELAKSGDVAGLVASARLLGLLTEEMCNWNWRTRHLIMEAESGSFNFTGGSVELITGRSVELINELLELRKIARKNKDFVRADALRDGFISAGVILKDTTDGVVGEIGPDFDLAKLEALK
ncbi:MAG: hypothetical protein N2B02_09645 [Amylibacter sp.]